MINFKMMLKHCFIFLLLVTVFSYANAKDETPCVGCSLSGTNPVARYATATYTLNGSLCSAAARWTISCGSIMVGTETSTSVQIYFNDASCASTVITALNSTGGTIATITVTINTAPALSGGKITNTKQTINYNTAPMQISATAATNGSACGGDGYEYQWYYSTDNSNFYAITGANGLSYTPGALTATTYYLRKVTCGPQTASTLNTAMIIVYPKLVSGNITPAAQTIYNNAVPAPLSITGTTGGSGTYTYQWQSATSASGPFTSITGATTTSYAPPAATASLFYIVLVSSNGVTVSSPPAAVNLYPPLSAGSTVPLTQATVLYGASASQLSLTGVSGGDGNYSYQWQSSTDNTTWTSIASATGNTYTPTNMTAKTRYRVMVSSAGMSVASNSAVVNVYPSPALNYLRTRTITKRSVTTQADANLLTDPNDVAQGTQYYDGLGRPIQTVTRQQSPTQKDMIAVQVYDKFDREVTHYMPYTSTTAQDGEFKIARMTEQNTFNTTQFPGEQYYYGQTDYEASPLNRVLNTYSPGNNWVGNLRGTSMQYLFNDVSDSVQQWNIAAASGSLPVTAGMYAIGQLYKNITTDESGHQVVQYTDKNNLVILKKVQALASPATAAHKGWACTYYVYDDLGNQRFVLQPNAVDLITKTWVVTPTIADGLCFQYEYDARNRMILKKVPGASAVYMVYDNRDRLVMTQDGNQRPNKQWLITKYDMLNRPVITALYTHTAIATQAAMTALVDAVNFYETYTGAVATHGYSNSVWPTTSFNVLTVNYYDNYKFVTDLALGSAYTFAPADISGQETTYNTVVAGQVTGSKINILNSTNYLWNVSYYDARYRSIQTIAQHAKNGTVRTTNVYDFPGKVQYTLRTYLVNGVTTTVKETFAYDPAGRVLTVKHSLNGATDIVLVKNVYDELGQLVDKKLHSTVVTGADARQSVDYRYNIRGWLTSMNNSQLTSDNGTTNDDTNDYFGMNLRYDQADSNLGSTGLYNGNISGMRWSVGLGTADIKELGYNFSYDALNRLTAANSKMNKTSNWQAGYYDEIISKYDLNGNIKNLTRKGDNNLQIDNLTYNYGTLGNQLQYVQDLATTTDKLKGFADGNPGTALDYTVDANGNMTVDNNKSITGITYNHLNLPATVTKKTNEQLKYNYDATGQKLSQLVFNASSIQKKKTEYVGEFFYENDTLKFINHAEGRVVMTGSQPEYQYNLKDHLGNVRVTFTSKTTTQQYTAGFEAANQSTESANFLHYPSGGGLINTQATNAHSGTNSELLNGGYNGQVGLAKSFAVMPGDQLQIQAYAKYSTPSTTATNYTSFVSALLSAFNLAAPTANEVGTASSGVNSFGNWEIGTSGDVNKSDPVKVFVTIILFDKNYNVIDVSYKASTSTGSLMSASYTVKEPGYAYLYVSNEHPTLVDVYIDDVSITYTPSAIVQMDSYYPFGLTFNSYSRENSLANQYKYSGKEEQDELNLGWLDYGARMYMPETG
ncbi:MAG TPA: DUF6443 domain-containing protein, partial [Cyclobacteriaceae bacterium]